MMDKYSGGDIKVLLLLTSLNPDFAIQNSIFRSIED